MHSPAQVAQIAGSIREFGFTNPILVDRDNGIIAGHGRLMAAQKLGLAAVPVTGATLAVAKLDRPSRNAAFLLTLQGSGVCFIAADMPQANDLTVGITALVAQREREAIARSTRAALAAAKARGDEAGQPERCRCAASRRRGRRCAADDGGPANVDRHARELGPAIADIRASGCTSLRSIAAELDARGMLTRCGGRRHVSNVKNLLARLDALGRPKV